MSLSAPAKEGLLRIVRLLENMEDNKFDLSSWHNENRCGTIYCAMGFAASTEWFQERGLTLDRRGVIQLQLPSGQKRYAFEAVASFLGITLRQADYLFMPHTNYSSKEDVIRRVRRFVAKDGVIGGAAPKAEERARLEEMLSALDAKLALEKGVDASTLMRKILTQGECLVPTAS